MKKVILIVSIVLTAILAIGSIVGFVVLNKFQPISAEEESTVKYEIIVDDEIKVYVGQDNYISPYLVSNGGSVEAARFDYTTSSEAVSIGFDGLVTINSIPDDEVLVNISERNTGTEKQIKLNIIQNLESVLGLIAPDGDLIRGAQKLVVGNTYALSVVTEPNGFSIEKYCTVKIADNAGVSKDVFNIDYDGGKILLTVVGIGKGKIVIKVVNDNKESIYNENIDFESTMTDEVLTEKIIAQSGQTLLSRDDLEEFDSLIIDSAITDLASLSSLPNLKTVFIDGKEVLTFENLQDKYCYRVPEALFYDYYENAIWSAVNSNLVPYDEQMSGAYVIYHSEKAVNVEFEKISDKYQLKTYNETGYVNSAWNDSEGQRVLNKDVQAITENGIHVYAVWRPVEYNVVYHFRNFAATATDTWEYETEKPLRDISSFGGGIEWEGYRFVGWTDNSGASTLSENVKYEMGKSYTKLSSVDGSAVHLYDLWTPVKYNIVFKMPNDVTAIEPLEVTYKEGFTLPAAFRVGYNFKGWKTADGTPMASGDHEVDLASLEGAEVILTPVFEEIKYKVIFDLSGGKALHDTSIVTGAEIELTYTQQYNLPTLIKSGYTVDSWKCLENDMIYSSNEPLYKEFETACTVTFKAIWTAAVYTINYDCNGGQYNGQSVFASGRYWNDESALLRPSREGYTFVGWHDENKDVTYLPDSIEWKSNLISSTDENGAQFYLKALWTANTYTLTLTGGVTPNKITVTFDSPYGPLPTPSKSGYTFSGWYVGNTKIDSNSKVKVANNHTAEPHWTANRYSVFFDSAGGTSCSSITVLYNGVYNTLPTPSKTGYTFAGWYLNGEKISNSSTVKTLGSHTLTAQWTANKYTVSFNSDGGDACSSITVTYNGTYSSLPTPSRGNSSGSGGYTSYAFDAWYYGDTKITNGTKVTTASNHTLKAKWTSTWHEDSKSCLVKGTLIMLPDGTYAKIEDLALGDVILTFDHSLGKYVESQIAFTFYANTEIKVITLLFSNGTVLKMANGGHGAYDLTLNKYVFITPDNVSEFVGHTFSYVSSENGQFVQSSVEMLSYEITTELVERYDIATANQLNHVAEGILACSDALVGFCNVFDFDEDMTYNEEKMMRDIQEYGLYSYDSWSEYVTYEEFVTFNGAYFKIAIEKGLMTEEELFGLISNLRKMWQ